LNANYQFSASGHRGIVEKLAFSPDSRRLVSAGADGTIRIWEATSGSFVSAVKGETGSVTALAFSDDSTYLAAGMKDGSTRIWALSSGNCIAVVRGHLDAVKAVGFTAEKREVVTVAADRTIRLTNIAAILRAQMTVGSGERYTRALKAGLVVNGFAEGIDSAFCSTDGLTIAASHNDGTVTLIRRGLDAEWSSVRLAFLADGGWAAFESDGTYRVSGDPGGLFWWTAGLCRFEAGEIDGYGVELTW
jgi:WD40 repeat protein